MRSVEEKVEEWAKQQLDAGGVRHFAKTESINPEIDSALEGAPSKRGGKGGNLPDIKVFLETKKGRRIPVLIEAKGREGDLGRTDANGALIVSNRTAKGEIDYRDGKVRLVEKKVTEIFDVANTHCVLGEWVAGREGHVPYVTASSTNNSVSGYVDYKAEFLDWGNAIFIGGKTFVVTYQKDDFFSNDSHNLVLRLKDKSRQIRDVYLYLVATINAGMGELYSWGDSISFKKIQKDKIVVPVTPAGELDFDFMEKLTRAVMKLAIRGVIEWKDREIAATKKAARSS